MSTPKPTLTAYSPGDVTGYVVTAANYNTEVLQQGAWTQLMLGAASSFPASPNTSDTCFRSDLGAWFRYDGAAWQQMGLAFFTTATRPAAPPTNYRYADLTDGAIYRYNGSTYDGAWIAPTFVNSWVNFGAPYQTAGYFKDAGGVVHIRGLIKSGTVGSAAFVLPTGYRPSATSIFTTSANSAFGETRIDASGNVTPTTGSNVYFSLDGITFDTR
jgi:hypothetical protein